VSEFKKPHPASPGNTHSTLAEEHGAKVEPGSKLPDDAQLNTLELNSPAKTDNLPSPLQKHNSQAQAIFYINQETRKRSGWEASP